LPATAAATGFPVDERLALEIHPQRADAKGASTAMRVRSLAGRGDGACMALQY